MTISKRYLYEADKDPMSKLYELTLKDNQNDFDTLYWMMAKLVSALEERNLLSPEEIMQILKVEPMPTMTDSEAPESEVSA